MKKLITILIIALFALIGCTKEIIFIPEVEITRADIPAMDFISIQGPCTGEVALEVIIDGSVKNYGIKTYALISIKSERFETLILKWRDSRGLNIKTYDNNTIGEHII